MGKENVLSCRYGHPPRLRNNVLRTCTEFVEQELDYHQSLPDPAGELVDSEWLTLEIRFLALAQSMMQCPYIDGICFVRWHF